MSSIFKPFSVYDSNLEYNFGLQSWVMKETSNPLPPFLCLQHCNYSVSKLCGRLEIPTWLLTRNTRSILHLRLQYLIHSVSNNGYTVVYHYVCFRDCSFETILSLIDKPLKDPDICSSHILYSVEMIKVSNDWVSKCSHNVAYQPELPIQKERRILLGLIAKQVCLSIPMDLHLWKKMSNITGHRTYA